MSTSTMSINAELYRQLGCIADDETQMKKVLRYVKRLVCKSDEAKAEAAREKAETIENLRHAFAELKAIEDGKLQPISEEEFQDEMRREGYYV